MTTPSNLSGTATAVFSVGVPTLTMRTYFSRWHRFAARRLRDSAVAREAAGLCGIDEAHRADVVLAVMSSVAFLEAVAHEAALDMTEKPDGGPCFSHLAPAHRTAVAAVWSTHDAKLGSSLRLFAKLLGATGSNEFEEKLHEQTGTLFKLRNALVHGRPADTSAGPPGSAHQRIVDVANELKAIGYALHTQVPATHGNGDWPDRLISTGCAEWAVRTADAFAAQFADRMGAKHWW